MGPQHIRKKTKAKTFGAIERLERLFDVRLGGDVPLRPGDFLTFDEAEEQGPTGRSMTYRISHATDSKTLAQENGWSDEEVQRRGIEVYGLVPPEYRRLHSILSTSFIVALVLERGTEELSVIDGPVFLPYLVCPAVDVNVLLDFSQARLWPPGIYSLHWMIEVQQSNEVGVPLSTTIVDMMAWTWACDRDDLFMQELDCAALRTGHVINADGRAFTPEEPEGIYAMADDEEEMEEPDPFLDKIIQGDLSDDELEEMMFHGPDPDTFIAEHLDD